MPSITPSTRATPMSPEDRRRSIIDATVPLLMDRGGTVTTAEIADAAGVAEGTIYRAFADKPTLIVETVKSVIDAAATVSAIDAIDDAADLPTSLRTSADILAARTRQIMAVVDAVRTIPHDDEHHRANARAFVTDAERAVTEAVTRLLTRFEPELAVTAASAASVFRGAVLAFAHPMLASSDGDLDDACSIVLDGIRAP
ncbi:MAG: TetR/AcrR family transcriptional regulator [Acidimicrobiia bacterium]|nr:TetR/AcrR family transcriptional regulator [Acidimicrobiia bacterium]